MAGLNLLRPTDEELTRAAALFREDEPQHKQLLSLVTDNVSKED